MRVSRWLSVICLLMFPAVGAVLAQKHLAPGDRVIRGNRLISTKSEPGRQLHRTEHRFVTREIVVDGRMQEQDWDLAAEIGPLFDSEQNRDSTSVRVLFDGEHIYLFWSIEQEDGITAGLEEFDGVITGDDYVQVDLKPWLPDDIRHGRDYYYTIAVNPIGTVWDAYFDPYLDGFFFSSWNSGAEVATVRRSNGWDLEMRIRFDRLDVYSDPGWNWQLKFHHASQSGAGPVRVTSADLGVTVTQDRMVRRPELVAYYWPRPEFMQEVKPDMSLKPEYSARLALIDRRPAVDSRRDSELWTSVPVLEVARTDRMGERLEADLARAQVARSGNTLVLNLEADGAELDEREAGEGGLGQGMEGQMAGVNGVFVDQSLFQRECFWVILQPRKTPGDAVHHDYYMIVIDNRGGVRGTHYDAYGAPTRSWQPPVEVDLYESETGWGSEVLIDLSGFDIPVKYEQTWGFNVFRNRMLGDDDSELQAWSYTGNNFLDPTTFGVLEGIGELDGEAVKASIQRRLEYLQHEIEQLALTAESTAGLRNLGYVRAELDWPMTEPVADARALEAADQKLGAIEAKVYYDSVPHPAEGGYPLMDVQFIGRHGWAVGAMGTVLRSEDGGGTWERVNLQTDADLYRVNFVSRLVGWAAGGRMRIAETNESMRHDRRGGYGYIFHTRDGGRTWTCQFGERGRLLLGLDFVNERVGYAVGERGYLLKTEDGGDFWRVLPTTGSMNWLYGVRFKDELTGFAVGLNETVIKTEDGGLSWKRLDAESDRRPYGFRPIYHDISFNGNTGCIVGQNGAVMMSNDGGLSWHPSATFFKSEIRDLMDLRSVHFVTPERGYAVGELGTRILVTEDGGASWRYQPLPNTGWLRAVWASAEGAVVIVGEQERILKSDDGGSNWDSSPQPKADVLVMMAHGDDAAINLNAFFAHYTINQNRTIVDLGTLSDVHSSEYEETYNLEHDRNMWMIGVRTATNFNEFETGNNGSDYYHFTERLWEGEENVVRHHVAAIRAYRPDVVITHGGVFGDYDKPGHKLSGRAGLVAFDTAGGEVDHYPELTRLGLPPWQPKKLYHLASESYPATLDLAPIGETPLKGTDMTCLEFGEYVIRNFQSQGIYHTRNGKLSLVRSLVAVPDEESSVFDGLE
jgi:photosystem II stability/assembly factor-like uncharacterized protein